MHSHSPHRRPHPNLRIFHTFHTFHTSNTCNYGPSLRSSPPGMRHVRQVKCWGDLNHSRCRSDGRDFNLQHSLESPPEIACFLSPPMFISHSFPPVFYLFNPSTQVKTICCFSGLITSATLINMSSGTKNNLRLISFVMYYVTFHGRFIDSSSWLTLFALLIVT